MACMEKAARPLLLLRRHQRRRGACAASNSSPASFFLLKGVVVAMEQSELLELGQWDGLGVQLHTSASADRAALPPPPPSPAQPAPQPWGYAIWESLPCAPPVQLHVWGEWPGFKEPQPQTQTTPPGGVPMVPWPYPWDLPPHIDLTEDDNDE
jgi:hypothetical protein